MSDRDCTAHQNSVIWIFRLILSLIASLGFIPTAQADQQGMPGNFEVIVKVSAGSDISPVLGLLDGLLLDEIPDADTYLVSVTGLPGTLPENIEYLEANVSVSLPIDVGGQLLRAPADSPTDVYANQNALRLIRLPEAKAYSTGLGVLVADIDSRFDESHPALEGRFAPGFDFVTSSSDGGNGLDQSSTSYMFESGSGQSSTAYMMEGAGLDQSSTSYMFEAMALPQIELLHQLGPGYSHGTFTAGVIAATAPEALIMPLRVFDDQGRADTFMLAKAIRFAVRHGADIINMSWGTDEDSKTLSSAIKHAASRNLVLISSAGNSNTDTAYFPAAYDEVIAVSATDDMDVKADFSSFGVHVGVSAPGQDIVSTMPDGYYGVKSGTSFSAPIVAGQAALLISIQMENVGRTIGEAVVNIADKNPGYQGTLGSGRVDLLDSIDD